MAFYNVFHVPCERLFPWQGHNYFLQKRHTQNYVKTLSDFCHISVSRKRNMFPETEVLRLLISHSAHVKFHLAFMDCLKNKVKLHFSERSVMKHSL